MNPNLTEPSTRQVPHTHSAEVVEPAKTAQPFEPNDNGDAFKPEVRSVPSAETVEPRVIPRADHPISRKNIARDALTVLGRLRSAGYKAYLVGGAVRDLYLGKAPKDYDVATDARPSRIKKIFRNCRIIGRRFRIAHVYFPSGRIVEVATFRQDSSRIVRSESGVILRDNEYGTPAQDARRRDLTINGLFYDIDTFSVIDYVGGVQDLEDSIVRMINEPGLSFREDPARMIRALRHAARTGFTIEAATFQAVLDNRREIVQTNPSRLLEEFFKDLRGGSAYLFFRSLLETGLFSSILPGLASQIEQTGDDHPFWNRMQTLDQHTRAGKEYSNPVLLSLLLHTRLLAEPENWNGSGNNPPDVWRYLSSEFRAVPRTLRISRRETERVAQILICFCKLYLCRQRGKLTSSLRSKVYLPEALQFFEIDLESRGEPTGTVERWMIQVAEQTLGKTTESDSPSPGPARQTSGRGGRKRRRGRSRGQRRAE